MTRPLRVLTLLDTIRLPGGAESMALQICEGIQGSRFRSHLCLTRWEPGLEREEPDAGTLKRLRSSGIPVLGLPRRSTASLLPWQRLLRYLREERIDILHAHKFGSNAWGAVIARMAGTPVMVAHEHMWSFEGARVRRFVDRSVIGRFADAFVAVSADAKRRMIVVEGVPESKVVLIRNGVPPMARPDPAASRRALGIPDDSLVIGSLGLLRPEKAFDVLIGAAAALGHRFPNALVLIAGDGTEQRRLKALRAELGLQDRVWLLGYRDDVPELLAASDVCVCCSDYEGGPLSVMEYMAAGRPVVATRTGGLPELVDPEVTGLLVEPRDPLALATALERLLGDRRLRERLGGEGRARAERELSLAHSLAAVEDLYLKLAAKKGVNAA